MPSCFPFAVCAILNWFVLTVSSQSYFVIAIDRLSFSGAWNCLEDERAACMRTSGAIDALVHTNTPLRTGNRAMIRSKGRRSIGTIFNRTNQSSSFAAKLVETVSETHNITKLKPPRSP
uniref:Secreted protein n=1 Tax=Anopheles maculatus TaxID=74869 RepID=A0A182SSK0_9DIPT